MTSGFQVTGLSVIIKLPVEREDYLDKLVKQLEDLRLRLKSVTDISIAYRAVRDFIPRIMFTDDQFGMQLIRNELHIDMGSEFGQRITVDETSGKEPSEKPNVFDKANLVQVSSEINYIIGLIVGQLGAAKKLLVDGNVELEAKETHYRFDHLLSRKMMLSKTSDTHVSGIQFSTTERLWDTDVQTKYRFLQRNENSVARVLFSFELSSPLDLSMITYTLADNLNNVFRQIEK